jgi:hypothetical protein
MFGNYHAALDPVDDLPLQNPAFFETFRGSCPTT